MRELVGCHYNQAPDNCRGCSGWYRMIGPDQMEKLGEIGILNDQGEVVIEKGQREVPVNLCGPIEAQLVAFLSENGGRK